jgi:hypothetical protein
MLKIIEHEVYNKYSHINFLKISRSHMPPEFFNGHPSYCYSEDISINNITSSSYCNLTVSHPLLPIYLTTNNRGIISSWSFESDSKKSIDEYYIEKITKESISKIKNLKRLKFNSYGNEFLTIDDIGNLFIYEFENTKNPKLPKITLWNGINMGSKDGVFLNNSGILATTYNKTSPHHTHLWDFLLPINSANVGAIDIGGNLITDLSSDNSLIICNEKPGIVSFVDIRRMGLINSFQAHLDEIKSIKVSDSENFLVTCGKGRF